MYNPFSLAGKTILITGASSGIGRETAIECSRMGAKVIITARNAERLQQTFVQLEGDGHQQIIADLIKQEDLDKLIDQVASLDGLVNNAGIAFTKPIPFINHDDIEKVFEINTFSPILLTKQIVKKRKLNAGASVVIMSSIASIHCTPGNSIYGTSKAAIKSFSEFCALEVASKEIRVNSILPGWVKTEMTQDTAFSEEELELERNRYPLKRYAEPKEVAWAVVYLLSDASKWVTGTQLVIDGGIHLV